MDDSRNGITPIAYWHSYAVQASPGRYYKPNNPCQVRPQLLTWLTRPDAVLRGDKVPLSRVRALGGLPERPL